MAPTPSAPAVPGAAFTDLPLSNIRKVNGFLMNANKSLGQLIITPSHKSVVLSGYTIDYRFDEDLYCCSPYSLDN